MNNIAIKIGDYFLELPDVTIRFKKQTTLFSESVVPVLYSFPFTVPDSPNNIKNLNFINLPEVDSELKINIPCKVYLFGNFWMNGIIEVNKYYTGGFDCNLFSGIDESIKQLLQTPLRNLDFGEFNAYSLFDKIRPYYVAQYNIIAASGGVSYNVEGVGGAYSTTWFTGWEGNVQDTIDEFIADANSKSHIHGMTLSVLSGPISDGSGGWFFTFVALGDTAGMLGPESVDDQLARERVIISCLNNSDDYLLQQHANALANDEAGEWYRQTFGEFPYQFPLIKNNLHTGVEVTNALLNKLNLWDFDEERFVFNEVPTFALTNFYNYTYFCGVACPFVSEIFSAIQRTTKYEMDYSLFVNTLSNLLLLSNGIMTPKEYTALQQPPNYIDLRCSMPDMTIEEFLLGIKLLFSQNFSIDYVNSKIEVKSFSDIIGSNNALDITSRVLKKYGYETKTKYDKGFDLHYTFDTNDTLVDDRVKKYVLQNLKTEVANIAALPSTGNEQMDIRYVIDKDAYYIVRIHPQTLASTWVYFCDGQLNYRLGEAEINVSPTLSPILMTRVTEGEAQILMPELKQPAKVKEQSSEENPFKGRLAFWWGLQEDSLGRKYPFASYHNVDTQGDDVGDHTLKYHSDIGIYERYGKPFYDFLQRTKPFKFEVLMKPEEVLSFNDNNPIRIESTNYISHTLDFSISNKTKVDFVKVTMDVYKL
jgi:hypothetical protein